jgi:hypothetical protein
VQGKNRRGIRVTLPDPGVALHRSWLHTALGFD